MTIAPNDDRHITPHRTADGAYALSGEARTRLGEAGLAVVPRRPTPRMVEAGKLAGNGDPALAAAIFSAMMDAAD